MLDIILVELDELLCIYLGILILVSLTFDSELSCIFKGSEWEPRGYLQAQR